MALRELWSSTSRMISPHFAVRHVEWDARIRKGWFATDELMSWKTECIATRELEDELLAENAVLENKLRRETERALRKRKM